MTVVTVVLVGLLALAVAAIAWLVREVQAYKILAHEAWAREAEDEDEGDWDFYEGATEREAPVDGGFPPLRLLATPPELR